MVSELRKYSECLSEARSISTDITLDQAIAIANGMYYAETMAGAIKSIENRLCSDGQGHKGLQSLVSAATAVCERRS